MDSTILINYGIYFLGAFLVNALSYKNVIISYSDTHFAITHHEM